MKLTARRPECPGARRSRCGSARAPHMRAPPAALRPHPPATNRRGHEPTGHGVTVTCSRAVTPPHPQRWQSR
eukprot:2430411-Rhodomonas_salina.2